MRRATPSRGLDVGANDLLACVTGHKQDRTRGARGEGVGLGLRTLSQGVGSATRYVLPALVGGALLLAACGESGRPSE